MNKLLMIAVAAALTGCAHFRDPAASKDDVVQCNSQAKHEALPWLALGGFGFISAKRSAFDSCMSARGYRTTAQQ